MEKRPEVLRHQGLTTLILSLSAGMVDAIGSLRLGQVLLANMSGNTVQAGIHGAAGAWSGALRYLWPVATFLVGLVVTGVVHEEGRRRRLNWMRTVLLVEALLLAALVALGTMWTGGAGAPTPLLVALGAGAMGMQNASLTHAAGVSVFTTHVTGTLTRLGQSLVASIFWMRDTRLRAPHLRWAEWARLAAAKQVVREAGLMAGLWTTFLLGAVLGALAYRAWGLSALLLPCGVLVVMAADLRRHPLPPQ
jgi:uncharacterized membrane protein YoaK (UPF0700 family)